jgi:hypothetical protein
MIADRGRMKLVAGVVRDAIEATLELAGPNECDRGTALEWLIKKAEAELELIKVSIRNEASVSMGSNPKRPHVPINGVLGKVTVTMIDIKPVLKPDANLDVLKAVLGDKFKNFFEEVPATYRPSKDFEKALESYDGVTQIRSLVCGSVDYKPQTPRVNFPQHST